MDDEAKANRELVWTGIARMAEEALCVLGGNGIKRWPERFMQGIGGAGRDLGQPAFRFCPGRLDRVAAARPLKGRDRASNTNGR